MLSQMVGLLGTICCPQISTAGLQCQYGVCVCVLRTHCHILSYVPSELMFALQGLCALAQ